MKRCRYENDSDGIIECLLYRYCSRCDLNAKCDRKADCIDVCNNKGTCPIFLEGGVCSDYSQEVWEEYAPQNYMKSLGEDEYEGLMDDIYNSFDD